jgi:hypothetical protein
MSTDQDEMSNLYRGPYKDVSKEVTFIWPNGFREEECKKSAHQKQESSVVAMFVNGSGRIEQSLPFRPDQLTNMAATDNSCF